MARGPASGSPVAAHIHPGWPAGDPGHRRPRRRRVVHRRCPRSVLRSRSRGAGGRSRLAGHPRSSQDHRRDPRPAAGGVLGRACRRATPVDLPLRPTAGPRRPEVPSLESDRRARGGSRRLVGARPIRVCAVARNHSPVSSARSAMDRRSLLGLGALCRDQARAWRAVRGPEFTRLSPVPGVGPVGARRSGGAAQRGASSGAACGVSGRSTPRHGRPLRPHDAGRALQAAIAVYRELRGDVQRSAAEQRRFVSPPPSSVPWAVEGWCAEPVSRIIPAARGKGRWDEQSIDERAECAAPGGPERSAAA